MKAKFLAMTCLATLSLSVLTAHDAAVNHKDDVKVSESTQDVGYKDIHTKDVMDLLKSNPSLIIVDARTAEYDDGHRIGKAKFIPYDTREEVIAVALPEKNAAIVVYCTSAECPLSKYLAQRLVEMGYTNVSRYVEGLQEWETGNNPINKVKPGQVSGMRSSLTDPAKK
jgi:rhodanese-related sulfurtransferase